MKKLVLVGTGVALTIYGWSLMRSSAFRSFEGEAEMLSHGAGDDVCPDCNTNFGPEGVMTSAKLSSISQWIEFSSDLLKEALESDPHGSWVREEQAEWLMEALTNTQMIDDLEDWAGMLDEGNDPTHF